MRDMSHPNISSSRVTQSGFIQGQLPSLFQRKVSAIHACPVRSRRNVASAVMSRQESREAEIERLMAELERLKAKVEASNGAQSAEQRSRGGSSILDQLGKHSQGSRFCSVSTLDSKEFSPRIIAVAGRVPGLAAKVLRNAPQLGGEGFEADPELGVIPWTYVPRGYEGELVAVPMSEVLGLARDPVGLRVPLEHLGLSLSMTRDALAIVDRDMSDLEYDNIKFHAWDIDGKVHIGWFKDKPHDEEARCLGRVLCVFVEEDKEMAKQKNCWLEADEVF